MLRYFRIYNVRGDPPPGLRRQCFSNHTNGPLLIINPRTAGVEATRASEPGSRRLTGNEKRAIQGHAARRWQFLTQDDWVSLISPLQPYTIAGRLGLEVAKVRMLQCCRPCLPPLVD